MTTRFFSAEVGQGVGYFAQTALFSAGYAAPYVVTHPLKRLQTQMNLVYPEGGVRETARRICGTEGVARLLVGVDDTAKRNMLKRGVVQPLLFIKSPEFAEKLLPKRISQKYPSTIPLVGALLATTVETVVLAGPERAMVLSMGADRKLPLKKAYREFGKARPTLYFARQLASWSTYLWAYKNFIPMAESKLGSGKIADLAGAGVAALLNRTAVSVVDTVRNRALHPEASPKIRALTIARDIYRKRGARAFVRGLGPGLVQYAIVGWIQFSASRWFKEK